MVMEEKKEPHLSRSISPLLRELGKPIKTVDRAISKLYPVDEIDENMLGIEIKIHLATYNVPADEKGEEIQSYLNRLVKNLSADSKRPFEYQVFLTDGFPNAYAMPGGAICVSKSLITILENESELAAILSHEIGHIERGHLFDAARNKMLRRKGGLITIATYFMEIQRFLTSFTFSKTQEDEADDFGFRTLVKYNYDPHAMTSALGRLNSFYMPKSPTNPFEEIFATHPHLKHRMDKFLTEAKLWSPSSKEGQCYLGRKNLANLVTAFEEKYSDEWVIY